MKIIYLFIKTSVWDFLLALITGIISGACLSGMIFLINKGIETKLENFDFLLYSFIGAWITYGVTSVIANYTITKLSQNVILDMRISLSKKIMKASFQTIEHGKSQLLTILTDDIGAISTAVARFPNVTTSLAMIIGCVAYMTYISWELVILFLILFGLAYGFFNKPYEQFRNKTKQSRDTQKDLIEHFQALIHGLKELLLNRSLRSTFIQDILLPSAHDQKKFNLWSTMWVTAFLRSAEMMLLLGFGLILVAISKYDFVSFEELSQFLLIALFTLSPLSNMSSFLPSLGKIDVAMEQIEKTGLILDEASVNRNASNPEFNNSQIGENYLTLKDVSYTYFHEGEDKFFQLGPINLEIKKGELIYLLGGNGSGKSTLAKILCGLYLPESGSVSMSGHEVTKESLDEFRESFSAIFTDFFLFDQLNHLNHEKIADAERYIKLLELDKKVSIKDNRLSTVSLSTGQRTRLALLMAYLDDKPFYIFDEWAASQDPYYKEVFYRTLLPELKSRGKTLIIITHDEKYFDGADRIVMLQDGQMLNAAQIQDYMKVYENN
ncbi:MAG: hypothetical protein CMP48_14990 [Rickettsiales bacterium]|nr:hypothetical protein [Rickettsiales bacterium]